MKRNIAIAVALVAVTGFFYKDFLYQGLDGDRSWAAFQGYIEAAKRHDLETLARYSKQLSPTCQNESTRAECYVLMDNLYEITKNLKRQDFKYSEFGDRGGIIYTDYSEGDVPARFIVAFTRDRLELMVASIRYCLGGGPEHEEINADCLAQARASI